jgi:hypothetical protein
MIALASYVMKEIVRKSENDFRKHFNGLTFVVPDCSTKTSPYYHSIVGQKLLLVDWCSMYGLQIACPDAKCNGLLKNERTNFSKNQTLFPIFGLDGPPSWCMVMSMVCSCCKRRFNSNDGEVILQLPSYIAAAYPVETKYALADKTCHLAKNATEVFDSIMLTYGNGELCSRLLYNMLSIEPILKELQSTILI